MKEWLDYDSNGDLPVGIHQATLAEVIEHFGEGNFQRRRVAQRLARIYDLAQGTGQAPSEGNKPQLNFGRPNVTTQNAELWR